LTRRRACDVLTYDAVWSPITAWNTVRIIREGDVIVRKRVCCRDVVHEELLFTNMVVLRYF